MKRSCASLAPFLLPVLLAPVASACSDSPSDGAPVVETAPAEPTALGELVAVDHIAIYQAVEVKLVAEGARVKKPNAPVIPDRPALVRVHAKALKPRTKVKVVGELHIEAPGVPEVVVKDFPRTLVTYDEADLETTFNFELEGHAIAPDATSLTSTAW